MQWNGFNNDDSYGIEISYKILFFLP